MYTFGTKSQKELSSVHQDLQALFLEVIKHRNCSIISGIRSQEEQQALYAKGRTLPGDIVTHKDGINRRSYHQSGMAVDVLPYFSDEPHIRWRDKEAFLEFGNFVQGVAVMLKRYGAIDHDIEWGGNWQWKDYPHWQI